MQIPIIISSTKCVERQLRPSAFIRATRFLRFLILVLAAWYPTLAFAQCSNTSVPSGNITYAYDPNGRLVGVVNSSGSAASYQFDTVGNLLSITRPTAAVNVLALSPQSGPASTCVMIYGTGFSSTPSQNTVKFDGTAGTVSYSTPTTIVVAVPSGASTGTVSVTSPSGSANSPNPFTVN